MRVLVVNSGSSSIKLRVVEGTSLAASADLDAGGDVTGALHALGPVDASGHRVVHGGERFREPVVVDDDVVRYLRGLIDLAPLHQPAALDTIEAVIDALPDVPAVACFDTAFHATIPPAAHTYALPGEWRERFGIRRFGFHGLSHAYAARRAAGMSGAARVVTCHLGAGASLAAVRDGRSAATTMGFTPLEGLVMATRSGSVDPGLLLWLASHGISLDELTEGLETRSGLLGLAGTPDMREVLRRATGGEASAVLALDVYVHSLRSAIAAMAAALDGLDALVFTGGVGENAAAVRARTASGLTFLGVVIDPERNEGAEPDADVSGPGARVRTLVVAAREDLEIAREVRSAVGGDTASRPV